MWEFDNQTVDGIDRRMGWLGYVGHIYIGLSAL